MDHSIVFSGRLRDGCTPDEVRANFARLFRLEPGPRLDALFSGRPVTLKKGLSEDEARRYADTLLRAGAHCQVLRPGNGAPAPSPAAPVTPAAAAPAKPAPASALASLALMPMDKPAEAEPAATVPDAAPSPLTPPAAAPATSPYAVGSAARRSAPMVEANSSGSGSAAYLPDEARGLSWGGFLMNWMWGLGNGSYVALLALLPLIGFFVPFYLLFKGRELAWRNKRWESVEHFNRVQRRWGQVGLAFLVLVTWWGISAVNNARSQLHALQAAQAAQTPESRQRALDDIKDPALREKMRQLGEEMERARAARAAGQH